jgi:hypothetical protein
MTTRVLFLDCSYKTLDRNKFSILTPALLQFRIVGLACIPKLSPQYLLLFFQKTNLVQLAKFLFSKRDFDGSNMASSLPLPDTLLCN